MSKFLANKIASKVSLLEGKILLEEGAVKTITDQEAEHPEIIEAQRRGWVTINDNQVASEVVAKPEIKFENESMKGSLTPPGKEAKVEEPKVEVPAETEAPAKGKKAKAEKVE